MGPTLYGLPPAPPRIEIMYLYRNLCAQFVPASRRQVQYYGILVLWRLYARLLGTSDVAKRKSTLTIHPYAII